jgi:hypothetical protein
VQNKPSGRKCPVRNADKTLVILVVAVVVGLGVYEAVALPGGPAGAVAMVGAVATLLTALAAVIAALWRK